jgi:membrane protein
VVESAARVGGVIVLLLWFYISSLAILVGAELNAEIEHASPYGKAPGQKNAHGKLLLGRRAERAFHDRQPAPLSTPAGPASPTIHDSKPRPILGALFVGGILLSRLRRRKRGRRDTYPPTPAAAGSRER